MDAQPNPNRPDLNQDQPDQDQSDRTAPLTGREFQRTPGTEQWRVLGDGAAAFFTGPPGSPNHALGAALARDILTDAAEGGHRAPDLDLRGHGLRVGLPWRPPGFTPEQVALAAAVTARATPLRLRADPSALQDLQLTFDAVDTDSLMAFWHEVTGHRRDEEDLRDPHRLLSPIWFQPMDEPRPLRNRLHLDLLATVEEVARTLEVIPELGAATTDAGPYGALVTDAEGNEADLLWREEGQDRWLADGLDLSDWRQVFDAQAWYPCDDTGTVVRFVTAVAELADTAAQPLRVAVRPGWVVVSTGKDGWENTDLAPLAAAVQASARGLGLRAASERARFLQLGIDAADVEGLRRFWCATLHYEPDPREHVTDIIDPRGIGMPLFFQEIDGGDQPRRAQRNRIHVDLFLPDDEVEARVAVAVAAGGRVLRDRAPFWWTIADPEGNEIDLSTSIGREEAWGD
ncbi:VOC family protein [Aestuariimicrobium kwangyangense]|uniref:VOC family protein n=1 Tax=Aestuariimicrobium kwangyangense TaxID=396389 RepID=UPI00040DE592|nr:VOC family protein [Aestuariimicrobium kwangyangense]